MLSAIHPHPDWLGERLIRGTLPWQEGRSLTYGQFSERYTLRDSRWLGIFQSQHQAIACILWDSLWLPDRLFSQVADDEAVYLFIRFDQALGVVFTEMSDAPATEKNYPTRTATDGAIATATPTSELEPQKPPLDAAIIARMELEEVEGNSVLLVDDTSGNSTTTVFKGRLHFLALGSSHRVVQL